MKSRRNKNPQRITSFFTPLELKHLRFPCNKCGYKSTIKWTDKCESPKSRISFGTEGNLRIPSSVEIQCENNDCQDIFSVSTPTYKEESKWTLYGDESKRHLQKQENKINAKEIYFYCYTLVGLHASKHEEVKNQVEAFKKELKPGEPPSWKHHFTEIWSSKPEDEIFNLKGKEAKIDYAERYAKMIWDSKPGLVAFNTSGCLQLGDKTKDKKKLIKFLRDDIFSQAILLTLYEMRKNNKEIRWVFDNEQDTSSGPKIEGWAEECFRGLQHTKLFAWYAACGNVEPPTFSTPGSNFLSEIADFYSFWVRRDFEMAIKKQKVELASYKLGKTAYQAVLKNGDIKGSFANSFPLNDFYGLKRF